MQMFKYLIMIQWSVGIISFSRVPIYLDVALFKQDYCSLPSTDEKSEERGNYVTRSVTHAAISKWASKSFMFSNVILYCFSYRIYQIKTQSIQLYLNFR